jgi:hypothetical protein
VLRTRPTEPSFAPEPTVTARLDGRDGVTLLLSWYLALTWFIPQRYVIGPLGQIGSPADLLGVVLFLWWVYTRIVPTLTTRGLQPTRTIALADLMVGVLLTGLAFRNPLTPIGANGAMAGLVGGAASAGVILVATDGLRSFESCRVVLSRLGLFATALAFMGVVQWFTGYDIAGNLRPPGLRLATELEALNVRSGFVRAQGTANHPIEFSVVLAMTLPVLVHLALFAPDARRRWWWWAATALVGFAVPLSVSRSGAVSVGIAAVGILVPLSARYRANLIAFGLAGMAATMAIAPGLLGTIRSLFANVGNDPSISARESDYADVARFVSDHPWLGLGPGTFNAVDYFILDNQYLGSLVSTGLIGLSMTVLVLVSPIVLGVHLGRRCSSLAARHLCHSLAVSAGVGAATAAFFDAFAFSLFTGTSAVFAGIIGAIWRLRDLDQLGPTPPEHVRLASARWLRRWPLPAAD